MADLRAVGDMPPLARAHRSSQVSAVPAVTTLLAARRFHVLGYALLTHAVKPCNNHMVLALKQSLQRCHQRRLLFISS